MQSSTSGRAVTEPASTPPPLKETPEPGPEPTADRAKDAPQPPPAPNTPPPKEAPAPSVNPAVVRTEGKPQPPPVYTAETPPAMSFAKRYLEPASWIAVIAGIILGVWQLFIAHRDRQVDASLEFAERFSVGEVGAHRQRLDELWRAQASNVARLIALSDNGVLDAETLQDFKQTFILSGSDTTTPQQVQTAIFEIADFLDQVAHCVEFERCDGALAGDYFCRYAASFLTLYTPELDVIRESFGNNQIGAHLTAFVQGETCNSSSPFSWPF